MAIFNITYTMMGSGVIQVEAENAEEAENLAFDFKTEELLDCADFKGGFSVDDIELEE